MYSWAHVVNRPMVNLLNKITRIQNGNDHIYIYDAYVYLCLCMPILSHSYLKASGYIGTLLNACCRVWANRPLIPGLLDGCRITIDTTAAWLR